MAFLASNPSLARALTERAYTDPTPVQTAVLEPEAADRDLLVSAQTGSGKTVAYGLAIATTLLGEAEIFGHADAPIALIVAPTRELALQVQRELTWLYHYARARVVSCVGGMDPRAERRLLADGAHIVVGTPGRLRDHLERGALNIAGLKALVIDEADEMLDLGFREDLEFILETTPPERRTLLFSATLPKTIVSLAKHYQRDALRIQTSGEERGHQDIEYRVLRIAPHDVEHAIVNLLRFIDPPSALIFCNTRDSVRHLQATLLERGFSVVALSGELSQNERNHALQTLRDGRARVCVATDVAARGIDLPDLSLVIHADLPHDAEVLQHRSGRTGRAGRKGVSILLATPATRRRATQLLASARIESVWGDPPSPEAIRQLDQERFLENAILTEPPNDEEIASAKALLAQRSPEALTVALERLYRAHLPAAEDLADPNSRNVSSRSAHSRDANNAKDREPSRFEARGKRERHDAYDPRARKDESSGAPRASRHRAPMQSVWFRLDIGRHKRADPKWLVPLICRKGKITKQEIGAIRIFETETRFEIDVNAAERFAEAVLQVPPGDGRIEPSVEPRERDFAQDTQRREPRQEPRRSEHRGERRDDRREGRHEERQEPRPDQRLEGPRKHKHEKMPENAGPHTDKRGGATPYTGKKKFKGKGEFGGKTKFGEKADFGGKPKFEGKAKFGDKARFEGKPKFGGPQKGKKKFKPERKD